MKPIKIITQNKIALESALEAVNGKATTHTFTRASELQGAAYVAEISLAQLKLPISARNGASFLITSGHKLPISYKYKVKVTQAKLVRSKTGWTLTELSSVEVWNGGGSALTLTPIQDQRIISGIRSGYKIA